MATIQSIFDIKGSIGNLVIRNQHGKQIAYLKPHFSKEKWLKHPNFVRCRENAQNFGGFSKVAAEIYQSISRNHKPWFCKMPHNRLAKTLRANYQHPKRGLESINFQNAYTAFHKIDLSHAASQSKQIRVQCIGPNYAPTQCRISQLREIADLIDPHNYLQLECRILIRSIQFPEIQYHPDDRQWRMLDNKRINNGLDIDTGWFHSDHLPSEGILFDLNANDYSQTKYDFKPSSEHKSVHPRIIFAIIEWRSSAGNNPGPLYQQGIIKSIAVQMAHNIAEAIQSLKGKSQPKPNNRFNHSDYAPINPAINSKYLRETIFRSTHPSNTT